MKNKNLKISLRILRKRFFIISLICICSKAYSEGDSISMSTDSNKGAIDNDLDNKSRIQTYNEAKRYFKNKKYEEAKRLLEHLIDPSINQEHDSKSWQDNITSNEIPHGFIQDDITPYALLYYALVLQNISSIDAVNRENGVCDIKLLDFRNSFKWKQCIQEKIQAIYILEYLASKYREWKHYPDVLYWLIYINFDIGNYLKATTILNEVLGIKNIYKIYDTENIRLRRVPKPLYETLVQLIKLKEYYLTKIETLFWLEKILDKYPNDRLTKEILEKRIARDPKIDLENLWTKKVIDKFNLNVHKYSINSFLHSQKKRVYNVAVLLPFFLNKIDSKKDKSSFIFNLYKGINLAKEVLCKEGKQINIYSYDTKKDLNCLKEILNLEELKNMDFIIGPLFPKLVRYTANFAKKYQINMLNPLSYNDDMSKDNPFFYLFMPSNETQALKAAEYVAMSYNKDYAKNDIHGNPKEIAVIYDNKIDSKRRAEAFKKYIKIYTNVDIKIYMGLGDWQAAKLLSSFRKINNKKDKTSKHIREEEKKRKLFNNVKYLYVASNDSLVFGSIFAIIEMLKLNPTIIGHKKWIEAKTFDIEEFQRKNIVMVDPEYIDFESDALRKVRIKYYNRYNEIPDMFSYIGYDSMYFFGNMLHRYGTYFQTMWNKDQRDTVNVEEDVNESSMDGFITKDSFTHDKEKQNFKTSSSDFTEETDVATKKEAQSLKGQIFAKIRYARHQNNQEVEMVYLRKGKIFKKQVDKLHPYLYVNETL